MKTSVIPAIKEMVEIFFDKHVSRTAAAVSYYLTFSIFPFIICVNAILGSLNIEISSVVSILDKILPESTLNIITGYIGYVSSNDSSALLVTGITLMLTSASAAFRSISSVMRDIQGQSRFRGLYGVAASFIMAIALLIAIYAAAIVVITGEWFLRLLDSYFQIGYFRIWNWLRFILLFLFISVVVYGIYYITQPKDSEAPIITGAIAATLVMVAVSIVFSVLISASAKYTLVYGSLASIIILMFWLYSCGIVLVMGNALNIVLGRHGAARKKHKKTCMKNYAFKNE